MTIIAIISAAILGTAAAAMENARRSRTRSLVTKIHGLVMERWDSYATRRVDVSPLIEQAVEQQFRNGNITSAERGQILTDARLMALRELIKMEMPDRWSDIINQPMQDDAPLNAPSFLADVPGLTRTYYRRLRELQINDIDLENVLDNQSAECLYLLVMFGTGDGEARTLFTSADIGDTDGDGAPEFIDGWGNPIFFVRWPAGFTSESTLMTGDGDTDHDPFDVFRRDTPKVVTPDAGQYPGGALGTAVQEMRNRNQQAIAQTPGVPPYLYASRLVPLIFSGGPDADPGLHLAQTVQVTDPYIQYQGGNVNAQLAAPLTEPLAGANYDGDTWEDNIHNHLIEY